MKNETPAFPGIAGSPGYGNSTWLVGQNGENIPVEHNQGMTLRDYRAVHILAGMLANLRIAGLFGNIGSDKVYTLDDADSRMALCHRAYILADDLQCAAGIPTGERE